MKPTVIQDDVNAGGGDELARPICVVGAGAAGLITAHTLVQDGFARVEVLTRDRSVGGTWARGRTYPSLAINK